MDDLVERVAELSGVSRAAVPALDQAGKVWTRKVASRSRNSERRHTRKLKTALKVATAAQRAVRLDRYPRTLGGHTIPVGWNCTNSMSMRSAPAS